MICDDQATLLRLAEQGAGLAYVFEEFAQPLIAQGSLVRVLEQWCPAGEGFFLYTPGRRAMPPALRALLELVKERRGSD